MNETADRPQAPAPARAPGARPDLLVAPFYRAPVAIPAARRALFASDLPRARFEALLEQAPVELRQDVARVFAAGLLARAQSGRVALVEGWRSNAIARSRGDRRRVVTGSWLLALLLRALERRGLLPAGPRPLRVDVSRCTVEEVAGIAGLARRFAPPPRIVGVAGGMCPSARRAGRHLARGAPGSRVLTPEAAIAASGGALDAAQRGLLGAVRLRPAERVLGIAEEAANWSLHALSELERIVRRPSAPLEQRLAHRLRRDADPIS